MIRSFIETWSKAMGWIAVAVILVSVSIQSAATAQTLGQASVREPGQSPGQSPGQASERYSLQAEFGRELSVRGHLSGLRVPAQFLNRDQKYSALISTFAVQFRSLDARSVQGDWRISRSRVGSDVSSDCGGLDRAWIRKSKRADAPTFVLILPSLGFFSDFETMLKSGVFTRTLTALDQSMGITNVIVLPGPLSSLTAAGKTCRRKVNFSELTGIYYRAIEGWLDRLGADPMLTGVIGFSDGGRIASEIVALESAFDWSVRSPRFHLGGLAIAPLLSLDVTRSQLEFKETGEFRNWVSGAASRSNRPVSIWEGWWLKTRPDLPFLSWVGIQTSISSPDLFEASTERQNRFLMRVHESEVPKWLSTLRQIGPDPEISVREKLERIRLPLLMQFSADDPFSRPGAIEPFRNHRIGIIQSRFGGNSGFVATEDFEDVIQIYFQSRCLPPGN